MTSPYINVDLYCGGGGELDLNECVICGGHRIAYSWPPVCSPACRDEWDIEVAFNKMAREECANYGEPVRVERVLPLLAGAGEGA
jgi:hypothetical protein